MTHPAVDDVCVAGLKIAGVGQIPRAYVVLKSGYQATGEEIVQFSQARLAEPDWIRGGIVFVEKLAKDSNGQLMINLEKLDKFAQEVDNEFLKSQPKVKVTSLANLA